MAREPWKDPNPQLGRRVLFAPDDTIPPAPKAERLATAKAAIESAATKPKAPRAKRRAGKASKGKAAK